MDSREFEQFPGFEMPDDNTKPKHERSGERQRELGPEIEPSLEKLVDIPEIGPEESDELSKQGAEARRSNIHKFIGREDNVMTALDASREAEFGADGRMRRAFRVSSKAAGQLAEFAHSEDSTELSGINTYLEQEGLEKFTDEEYDSMRKQVFEAENATRNGKEVGKWGLE